MNTLLMMKSFASCLAAVNAVMFAMVMVAIGYQNNRPAAGHPEPPAAPVMAIQAMLATTLMADAITFLYFASV